MLTGLTAFKRRFSSGFRADFARCPLGNFDYRVGGEKNLSWLEGESPYGKYEGVWVDFETDNTKKSEKNTKKRGRSEVFFTFFEKNTNVTPISIVTMQNDLKNGGFFSLSK